MDDFRQIGQVERNLRGVQAALEFQIMATPSGPCRNELTEANIHLMVAVEHLKKAMEKANG